MRHPKLSGIHMLRSRNGWMVFWRLATLSVMITAGVGVFASVPARAASSSCTWHTVVAGDTLGNLGWAAHSNALTIATINHIANPDVIYVGQRLCIPTSGSGAASRSAPERTCIWHTVVSGDTLGKLGWASPGGALGVARANNIPNPDLIYIGQHLCVPTANGDPPPKTASTSAPADPPPADPPPVARGASASGAQAFIQFVLPYARAAHRATGWPTSLIIAQWGLEQGWHVPSYTGYNFGNCAGAPGAMLVPGLNVPGSPSAFAYAPTPQEGLRIYVYVAHLNYYAAVAPAAARGGVDAAARALGQSPWDAGHYTATGSPGSSLLSILRTYNLYRYDGR